MIRLENVSRVFSRPGAAPVHALSELELEVRRGETLCLVGPSGCGKTTALRLINRLEEPTAGRVFVDGRATDEWDPIRLRRGIGYVLQNGGLFPHLTVAENVGLLLTLEGVAASEKRGRVCELLERVRLNPAEFGARFPAELSGGQRQRVGVARALALDPKILLMDEPFGALDPITRTELQDEFFELSRRLAKTIVLVSHNLDEAFRLGDRVALLAHGRLEQVGTEDELRGNPASEFVEQFLREPDRG